MSEWSIVQSWNGCVRKRTSGSNPDLCAKNSPFVGLFYLLRLGVCVAHNCFQQLFEPVFVASFECQHSRSEIYSLSLNSELGIYKCIQPCYTNTNEITGVYLWIIISSQFLTIQTLILLKILY